MMNSPFRNNFMSKSPLRKHNKIQKKINWFQNKKSKLDPEQPDYHEAQSNFDEQIEALRKDIPAAEAAHTKKRTEEEDAQVREDEDAAQGSAIEMQSPLHGYVDASDMVDPNPPTAHMWGRVFDAASSAYGMVVAAKQKKAAEDKTEAEKTKATDELKARQAEFAKRTRAAGTDTETGEAYEKGDLAGLGPGDKLYDQAYYLAFPEALSKRMSS